MSVVRVQFPSVSFDMAREGLINYLDTLRLCIHDHPESKTYCLYFQPDKMWVNADSDRTYEANTYIVERRQAMGFPSNALVVVVATAGYSLYMALDTMLRVITDYERLAVLRPEAMLLIDIPSLTIAPMSYDIYMQHQEIALN